MKKKPSVRNLFKNIPFIVSGMAVAALNTTSLSGFITAAIMFVVLVIISLYEYNIYTYWKSHISVPLILTSVFCLMCLGYSFYAAIGVSSKFRAAMSVIGMNARIVALVLTSAGIVAGIYFLSVIISTIYSVLILDTQDKGILQLSDCQSVSVTVGQAVFIFITAAAIITVCSTCSPLYPFNRWVDPNCFMTVGKSILNGMIPYRDLYEQKGPLLYIIHTLAAVISYKTFIGVYFFEIVAAAFFLYFSFKTMKLYKPSVSVLLIPVLAAVVYSAKSFVDGDSAEEFCLPLFAFAVYVAFKYIRQGKIPSRTELVMIGVTSACVLWIKFTMIGFYLGWFCVIVMLLVKHKNLNKVLPCILWIGVGILITTVPILVYFGLNHALADMWTVYFYNNLFLYSKAPGRFFAFAVVKNLLNGMKNLQTASPIPMMLIVASLMTLFKKKNKTDLYAYFIMGITSFITVYIGGQHHTYYAFIFSAFTPIGLLAVYETLRIRIFAGCIKSDVCRIVHRFSAIIICAVSLILALADCGHTDLLCCSKADLPQYRFAKIINQKEDATLLNYGFLDGGFYTTTGITPTCRFFCKLNIELKEMMETQNEFVEQGRVDFVVTRNKELNSKRYECIDRVTFSNEKYFLYRLIS